MNVIRIGRIGILFLLLILTFSLFGDSGALDLFDYQSNRMDQGSLYTYRVSNFDGDLSINMDVYMKGDNVIEFFKDYSTVTDMVFVIEQELNKDFFVFDNASSENPFRYMETPKSNSHTVSSWNYDRKRKEATMVYFNGNGEEVTKTNVYQVNAFPSFDISLYQFDFILAMRHFQGTKEDEFVVGGLYAGKYSDAIVSFDKEEMVDGVLCDKWVISGRGLLAKIFNYKQEFWFARDSEYYHLVQYKNHMTNISPFGNVQIQLTSIESEVSVDQWEDHVARVTEEARINLGFPEE